MYTTILEKKIWNCICFRKEDQSCHHGLRKVRWLSIDLPYGLGKVRWLLMDFPKRIGNIPLRRRFKQHLEGRLRLDTTNEEFFLRRKWVALGVYPITFKDGRKEKKRKKYTHTISWRVLYSMHWGSTLDSYIYYPIEGKIENTHLKEITLLKGWSLEIFPSF